jgi:transposase
VSEVVRQVIDVPPVRVTVTDHIAQRRRCGCGTVTTATFPPEAKAPVCWGPEVRALALYLLDHQHLPVERCAELLAELLDAPVSTGWLCQLQLEAAGKLAPFITQIKAQLGTAPVVHADETGTRIGVTKHWVHTLSTRLLTLLVVHPKRGVEALVDMGAPGGRRPAPGEWREQSAIVPSSRLSPWVGRWADAAVRSAAKAGAAEQQGRCARHQNRRGGSGQEPTHDQPRPDGRVPPAEQHPGLRSVDNGCLPSSTTCRSLLREALDVVPSWRRSWPSVR